MNSHLRNQIQLIAALAFALSFPLGSGCAADAQKPSVGTSSASDVSSETGAVVKNKSKPPSSKVPEQTRVPSDAPSHPVSSPDQLVSWLDTHADKGTSRSVFRFPIVIAQDPNGLGIARSFIGSGIDGGGPPVEVQLDDSALGIPLADRIRQIRPQGSVAIWIEGHWGPLVRAGMPVTQANKHTIAVRSLGEVIQEADINAKVFLISGP